MTDVVGTLSFALHAAHKIYSIMKSIKDAPSVIRALREDAFQVHGFLKKVLDSQEKAGPSGPLRVGDVEDPQIEALVKKAQSLTAMVDTFMSKTTTQKDGGTYAVKKLKWTLYAGDAKKLSEQFKAFYVSLTATYAITTSISIESMSSDLRRHITALDRHEIILQALYASATLREAAPEQREGRSRRFDEICETATRLARIALPRAEMDAAPAATNSPLPPDTHALGPTGSDGYRDSRPRSFDGSNGTSQAYDSTIASFASASVTTEGEPAAQTCADECSCTCHRMSSDISPIPPWLNPWLGRLNIPRTLAASIAPSLFPCNNVHCQRNRNDSRTVRYHPPVWSGQIEASIRFEAFPIHFCIQTPRVVPSLRYLFTICFDDFRKKLSTRELTLEDVETNGCSVLHRLFMRAQQVGDAFDLISYALNAGIPRDWEYSNMTAVEYAAYGTQCYPQLRAIAQSLDRNVVQPLLDDSLGEVSRTLNQKLKQSDLHILLVQPDRDTPQGVGQLRNMLMLPGMSTQINRPDVIGRTPMDYAVSAYPEAVEVLLQAGASTKCGSYVLHQRAPDQWLAISALIRSGYPVNARNKSSFGRPPLHYVAADRRPSYRHALELVRHGAHLLDWDARDDEGNTALNLAEYFANERSDNEQLQLIRGLYRTRRIPRHAQYISSFDGERLMGAGEAAMHTRKSLIGTALSGPAGSIGRLLSAGAMANERDEEGRTLLHLVAMGDRVPDAYRVVLELARYGGRLGVDWDAKSTEGQTALGLAEETLNREDLDDGARREVEKVCELLRMRRLPLGESYVFPCMDPDFCYKCGFLKCACIENDVPGMPGSYVN